jgi:hypothetical protein
MPNYNRSYSAHEFEPLMEKYRELCQVRDAAAFLTGEEEFSRIISALNYRAGMQREFKCPAHYYLGMTPSKRRAVEESWEELVQNLDKFSPRSVSYLVEELRKQETIEDARNYVAQRKNLGLESKGEKTFKRVQQ